MDFFLHRKSLLYVTHRHNSDRNSKRASGGYAKKDANEQIVNNQTRKNGTVLKLIFLKSAWIIALCCKKLKIITGVMRQEGYKASAPLSSKISFTLFCLRGDRSEVILEF